MSSRNVEENVVKMKFDNKDFDNNIRESEQTVNGFKGTLNSFKNAVVAMPAEIMGAMSRTLQNINLSDILGMAAALAGINLIKDGIVSIGETIQGVATSALSTINSMMTRVYTQIKEGGKQRALNIEQAKFQIKGLGLDVETFMEAANYGVQDTAYSLDAAAKAASQLGASGITSKDELKQALRGISGVAAMANSSYEEIADIYTTVAANGKLMTDQIRSMSSRGLNITAPLAKALNKTEAEIRDMVSKGQIDFKTFSKAMDDAFGQHAKDANETYAGSLSNINAALSKIGEGFQTPIITNMIDVFNQLRMGLNEFKTMLADNSVFASFGEAVKTMTDTLAGTIENIRTALQKSKFVKSLSEFFSEIFHIGSLFFESFASSNYTGMFVQIGDNLSIVIDKLHQIIVAAKEAIDEVFGITELGGNFKSLVLWASSLLQVFDEIDDKDVKDVFVSWLETLKKVFTTITEILGLNRESIGDFFQNAVRNAFEFFKNLKISDDEMDKLSRTAAGVASVIDIIKMFASELLKYLQPALGYIRPFIDTILSGTASVGDFLVKLRNTIKEDRVFSEVFEKIGNGVIFIKNVISGVKTNFLDVFFGEDSGNTSFFTKVTNFITLMLNAIGKAAGLGADLGTKIAPLFETAKQIGEFAASVLPSGEGGGKVTSFFDVIKRVISTIIGAISNLFGDKEEQNKVDDIAKAAGVGANGAKGSGGGFLTKFKDLVTFIVDQSIKLVTGITNALSSMNPTVLIAGTVIILKIIDVLKDVLPAILKFTAIMAAIIAAVPVLIITVVNIRKVLTGITGAFTGVGHISSLFTGLRKTIREVGRSINPSELLHGKETLAGIINAFAKLMLAITASFTILSAIPINDLWDRMKIIGVMLAAVAGIMVVFAILSKVLPKLGGGITKLNETAAKITDKDGSKYEEGIRNENTTFTSPLYGLATLFQAITIGILEISAAIFVLAKAGDPSKLWACAGIIGVMLAAISAIIFGMAMLTKIDVKGKAILKMGVAFAAIATSLLLIAGAIKLLATGMDVTKSWIAVAMISVISVVIAAIIGLLGNFGGDSWNMLAAGGSMLLAVLGITTILLALSKVIKQLNKIEDVDKLEKIMNGLTKFMIAFGIIATLLVAVGGLVGSIGEGIGALGIVALALPLLATGLMTALILLPVSYMIKQLTGIIECWERLIKLCWEIKDADVDAEELAEILATIVSGLPKGITKGILNGIADSDLYDDLKKAIPKLLSFIGNTIVPAVGEILIEIVPQICSYILQAIAIITDFMNKSQPSLLENIIVWLGTILVPAFQALIDLIGQILDVINANISMIEEKLYAIIINIISTANRILDENKDQIAKEIEALCTFIIGIMSLSLLSETNIKMIGMSGSTIMDVLISGIFSKLKSLGENMLNAGMYAAARFVSGFISVLANLGTFGLVDIDRDSIMQALFPGLTDDNELTIDVNFDTSSVNSARSDIQSMLNGYNYAYQGVVAANNASYAKSQQQSTNFESFKNGLADKLGGLFSDVKNQIDVNVDLGVNSSELLNIMNTEVTTQQAAGYEFGW